MTPVCNLVWIVWLGIDGLECKGIKEVDEKGSGTWSCVGW